MNRLVLALGALLAVSLLAVPGSQAKVVNENTDNLPPGCSEISEELSITVRGGREPAKEFPGVVFTFDEHSWEVPTCAKVTVTFINEDDVRHQFMPHGVWPEGFFLLEVDGPGNETGTFITPGKPTTIMAHCGVAQHQQKGMKAQFVVGGGVGDIPNIPTVSGLPPEGFTEGSAQGDEGSLDQIPLPALLPLLALGAAAVIVGRRRHR